MKMSLNTLMLFGFVLLLSQCKTGTKSESGISIDVPDAKGMKVFFDRTQINNQTEILSSIEIDANGHANLVLPSDLTAGLYRLRIGAKKQQLILDGTEKNISVSGSLNDIGTENIAVVGSPSTEELMVKIGEYKSRKMDITGITDYIKNAENPFNSVQFAMSTLGTNPEFYKTHQDALKKMEKYKDTQYYSDYKTLTAQIEQQYITKMANERIKVGEVAPDITMPNLKGKDMSLSDYKGKVVLLDFWASWCGPCRKSNPHLVEVYNKYKSKGFDVFSVSLDGLDSRGRARYNKGDASQVDKVLKSQKDRWKGAIEKDKLTWDGHVSDLRKWDTPAAKTYGVASIPKTFLIDRNGKIAAVNPRYNLEEELLKIL